MVAAGGSGSVAVTTAPGCAWTATSSAGWLATTSGASGSGPGTVGFTVAPNTGQSARPAVLTIGGQTFTVNQDAPATCSYTSTLSSLPLYAYVEAIGAGSYVWEAATADARAPQRAESGRVMSAWFAEEFSIDLNIADTQPHEVALYMADYDGFGRAQRVDVVDAMGVVLDSRSVSNFTEGQYLVWTVQGHVTLRVTRLQGNNAVVSALFVGPGTTVGAGSGTPSATFVKTDTTTQGNWKGVYGARGHVIVADATSAVLASAAGSGAVIVTAGAGCGWAVTSDAAWLTLPSGGAGSGSAMLGFNVAANSSSVDRPGTLTMGGQILRVTQSAAQACAYTLSAQGQALPATGGPGSVTVGTSAGCAWTSTSNAAWLTLTSGATGTGAGAVAFGATANTGTTARSAALTIGGQVYTVTQAPTPCAYAISAAGLNLTSVAGSGSVAVTAGAGCAWTTTSSAAWLTVTSGASGSGGGTVAFSASANPGPGSRTATLTVAGLTFTVVQGAAPCAFVVSPAAVPSMIAAGGTASVAVTSAAGCTWTATSSTAWLTLTPGAGGTGSGSATFSASSNPASAPRVGAMTVAGQTVTVTQAGVVPPCSIVLTPTTQSVNSKKSVGTIVVTTGAGCTWTAKSSAAWLTISSAVNSQGKVTYGIARNGTGANRTATVTVGSVTSTITQRTDTIPNPVSGLRVVGG